MRQAITCSIMLVFLLTGCSATSRDQSPVAAVINREAKLQRECMLLEYVVTTKRGETKRYVPWEGGKPTEYVRDDYNPAKPAKVVRTASRTEQHYFLSSDYYYRTYELVDKDRYEQIKHNFTIYGPVQIYEMPKWTSVYVKSPYVSKQTEGICREIRGTTQVPNTERTVNFIYSFGCNIEYISRAPWEDESVPEKRYLGPVGTRYRGDSDLR